MKSITLTEAVRSILSAILTLGCLALVIVLLKVGHALAFVLAAVILAAVLDQLPDGQTNCSNEAGPMILERLR